MSEILALFEHDRGQAGETSYQALGFARALRAAGIGSSITAVVIGAEADGLAAALGAYGADTVVQVHHHELTDYAPEAWGEAIAELIAARNPAAVVATGTDRGNEVLAYASAINDTAFAANVVEITAAGEASISLTRVRWGGSLLEQSKLIGSTYLLSGATHAFDGELSADHVGATAAVESFDATLSETAARTRVTDRVTLSSGITLTTAAVVVSGGRGVGSADGFAPLIELADLLGGAVGCSRVVTNNGWRPHSDQVGQTGKRIAPELYIACGISGAIQHWVGMMASKHVLAINTDGEANMVGKAEYAVIGDLHKILPAVSAEIRNRRA
ncbi:MAG: electron transfer flavoprotein subunit alpha/FixB family protein [Ilumatobacteraceae bacterium]